MWELDYKESWGPKNWCFWTVVLEKTLESPLDCKESKSVNPKGNQSWIFIGRTDAEAETPTLAMWCKELTPWKRLWCWERLKAGGEGDDRGWDGWMASPTLWTWVWASSRRWWWTRKPGMLQSMGSQRVGHYWATELNWEIQTFFFFFFLGKPDFWLESATENNKCMRSQGHIRKVLHSRLNNFDFQRSLLDKVCKWQVNN